MREVIISEKDAGQRFDKFLVRYLPGAGKSFLYKMLRKKNIVLNGKKAEGKEQLKQGDSIKIFFAEETLKKFQQAEQHSYPVLPSDQIVYEDGAILVINKPAGVLSQKADPKDVSLVEYIRGYLLESGTMTEEDFLKFRPGVSNRLDRNTSGIVLAGKNLAASRELSEVISKRSVQKFYQALVWGRFQEPFIGKAYLWKNNKTNKVEVISHPREGAVEIETAYTPIAVSEKATLLEVELITGKSHQIRAHLSYLGHPIVGDPKYGNAKRNAAMKKECGLQRQFLHAFRIVFPEMKGALASCSEAVFEAPLPKDLQKAKQHYFH